MLLTVDGPLAKKKMAHGFVVDLLVGDDDQWRFALLAACVEE